MKILIPTYMRETKQVCWENLPEEIRENAYLCTKSDRVAILKENYPDAKIIDLGLTDGIADVRQRLVLQATQSKDQKIMIIDDNCTFMWRDAEMKLKRMHDVEQYNEMFSKVEKHLDEYAWCGISDRAGNNHVEEPFKENSRSYSCYGINAKMLNEFGIRFDGMWLENKEIKLFEDFYVILSLLSSGKKNIILYEYAFNHPHGKPGGNSVFRTNHLQEMCYKELSRRFPGIIKLKVKSNASWTLDEESTDRTEANISWKKAYDTAGAGSLESFFD